MIASAVKDTLLVVARGRDEEEDPGRMPWPLTRRDLELFTLSLDPIWYALRSRISWTTRCPPSAASESNTGAQRSAETPRGRCPG